MKHNIIGFGKTPASNTGLNSQTTKKIGFEVSCDYITITCYVTNPMDFYPLIDLAEKTLDEKIEYTSARAIFEGKWYLGSSSESLRGTRVYTNPPTAGAYGEIRFKMPGKALAAASMHEIRDMLAMMGEIWSGKVTRFDGAIDDYSRVLDLDEVKAAQDAGNYAHVQKQGYHESGERGKKERGRTITFGARGSEAYLRIYDKSVESNGALDCIRYEVEFKDDKAQTLFDQWLSHDFQDEQGAAKIIAGAVLGAVRFCDRSSEDKNLDRCEDLPWYTKLCDSVVSGFRLRVRKKERFLDDSFRWVEKAVMPTLAMLRRYMGDADFLQWVYDQTDEQMLLLSNIKIEKIQQQQQLDKEQQQQHDGLSRWDKAVKMKEIMSDDGIEWVDTRLY